MDRLARELATLERATITEVVRAALTERGRQLVEVREQKRRRIHALQDEVARMPILDGRDHAAMLYDEDGVPR